MRDIVSTGQCPGCGAYPDEKHDSNCTRVMGDPTREERDARNGVMSTPVMDWLRKQGAPVDSLVEDSQAVDVVPPRSIVIAIPPEVEQYADDIRRFVDAMVFKLGQKSHKGRWEELPIGKAMALMEGEVGELTEAIERGNLVEVLLESADVANFALIVASIAIERGK